ncbi:MAG: Hsp33 family molecular chaperone HslO [Deltaproteobacteria bacterium]
MTEVSQWDDVILPFQLDRSDIRGRVTRLNDSLSQILHQHAYPDVVSALLAETATLTALIGQSLKLRWKLSLQVRGDGPVRTIATDYYAPEVEGGPARIRAYASFDAERLSSEAPFAQIGKGYFAVLIDQGEGNLPYQGITPLTGKSIADCASAYFAQSEQLPTRFSVVVGQSARPGQMANWRAGGVMLQHLPKSAPRPPETGGSGETGLLTPSDLLDDDEAENWNRANFLLDTVEEIELTGPDLPLPDLLYRLFHEETPRVYSEQAVNFGCSCSAEKVLQSLSIYSAKDIAHMTTDEGIVTADCQFCGAHYEFDPTTVGFEAK